MAQKLFEIGIHNYSVNSMVYTLSNRPIMISGFYRFMMVRNGLKSYRSELWDARMRQTFEIKTTHNIVYIFELFKFYKDGSYF